MKRSFLALFLAAVSVFALLASCGKTPAPPAETAETAETADPVGTLPAETDPADTTVLPETEAPATEPPATEPPATEPPATEPPATEPPATEPPATEPPATEPPATPLSFRCRLLEEKGDHATCPLYSLENGKESVATYKSARYPGKPMRYKVWLPRDYSTEKEYPILYYLHGLGGESMDVKDINFHWLLRNARTQEVGEIILVAPQCLPNSTWPHNPETREILFDLMKELENHLSVDRSRIYLSGHSYGSMGSLLLLAAHPGYFAAAVLTGGAGSYSEAQLAAIAKTPIRMFCGDKDQYGFYNQMRTLNTNLLRHGCDVVYTEIDGPHDVFNLSTKDPAVAEWMLSCRLGG